MQASTFMFISYEEWSYLDASYYSFVTFATIGFGDLVAGTRSGDFYGATQVYGVLNFLMTALGVCCMYSLFNIVSVVIKHVLNAILRCLDRTCCCHNQVAPLESQRRQSTMTGAVKHNAIGGGVSGESGGRSGNADVDLEATGAVDTSTFGVNPTRDILQANKMSLELMADHVKSQSRVNSATTNGRFLAGLDQLNPDEFGSVAMVSKQLEDDE